MVQTVQCPHCGIELQNDQSTAGLEVQCGGCQNSLTMPPLLAIPVQIVQPQSLSSLRVNTNRPGRARHVQRKTDPVAMACAAASITGLCVFPLPFLAIAVFCLFVSFWRLNEDKSLKGGWLLFVGALGILATICYVLSALLQDEAFVNEILQQVEQNRRK